MEHRDKSRYPPQYEGNAFVVLLEDRRAFADFLVDLATAADMVAFLKERFGH